MILMSIACIGLNIYVQNLIIKFHMATTGSRSSTELMATTDSQNSTELMAITTAQIPNETMVVTDSRISNIENNLRISEINLMTVTDSLISVLFVIYLGVDFLIILKYKRYLEQSLLKEKIGMTRDEQRES